MQRGPSPESRCTTTNSVLNFLCCFFSFLKMWHHPLRRQVETGIQLPGKEVYVTVCLQPQRNRERERNKWKLPGCAPTSETLIASALTSINISTGSSMAWEESSCGRQNRHDNVQIGVLGLGVLKTLNPKTCFYLF